MKNDTIQTRKWITTCLMALLTFCLVLTGIFFIAPIEAEAAVNDTFTVDNITYKVLTEEEGNYTVQVSGNTLTSETAVVIPSTVSYNSITYTVTGIGDSAFSEADNRPHYITSLSLPNSVTTIGKDAFYECTALKNVTIPGSVIEIKEYAFIGCTNLEDVVLSEGVTYIGYGAFRNCKALKSITIPQSVKRIEDMSFYNTGLEEVVVYSTDCVIVSTNYNVFMSFADTVYYGVKGSTLEQYCEDRGYTESFVALETPTYDLGGGTASVELPSGYYRVGDEITITNAMWAGITRTGYTMGTVTCNGESVSYVNPKTGRYMSTTHTMTEDGLSFVVNWTANEYTVTFDQNGGTGGSPTSATVTYGSTYSLSNPVAPTKEGYRFEGYYFTDNSGRIPVSVQFFNANMTPTRRVWDFAGDVTLTAKWTPIVTSISIPTDKQSQTYYAGGEFVSFNITATYGDNSTEEVEVTEAMLTNFSTDTMGTRTATVTYEGKTASFTYTVTGYAYKVEHYLQKITFDGYEATPWHTETLYGVGTTNAVARSYEGFTAKTVEQVNIAEDGTSVVKVYYDKNAPTLTTNKYDLDDDGNYDEVYELASEWDLKWFASQVNAGSPDLNAVLMNNISLTTEHIPIGVRTITGYKTYKTYVFTGMFDGQGYCVENLYIKVTTEANRQNGKSLTNGLFGITDNAIIKNVTVVAPVIDVNVGAWAASYPSSGGVVGYAENTSIENCYVKSGINTLYSSTEITSIIYTTSQDSLRQYFVSCGGLVGYSKNSVIKNCSVDNGTGTFKITPTMDASGRLGRDENAGGLVGYALSTVIENCYVSDVNLSNYSGDYRGGIAGYFSSSGRISNCYSYIQSVGTISSSCITQNVYSSYETKAFADCDEEYGTNLHNQWYRVEGEFNVATLTIREGQTAPYGQTTLLNALNYGTMELDGALAWEYGENGVTFVEPTVSSISIPAEYQNQTYAIGNDFKPFNIVVSYEQGGQRTIEVTADMVTGLLTDALTTTAKTATVTYGGKTATFTYSVTNGYAYTVKHYQENLEDGGYTLVEADTQTLYGVGTTAAVAKTYAGFTAQAIEQTTIAEDGSTVVEIRYIRNYYTITLHPENGLEDIVINFKYGEIKYADLSEILTQNEPEREGYDFLYWAQSKPNYILGGQPPTNVPVPAYPIPVPDNFERWAYYGMCEVDIIEQPVDVTKTYDGETDTLTVDVSQDGNSDFAVVYQWQISTDGATWNDISGATGSAITVSSVSDSAKYRVQITVYEKEVAENRRSTSATSNEVTVAIRKADQTITLSENEFTYSDGKTVDFAALIGGTGDGALSFEVSDKNGVAFDFANGVVSNITKAGGTFTLTVNRAASDNYNAATETFTVTLNKGAQTLSVSGTPSAPNWKEAFTVSVGGNKGALSYAITSGNASVDTNGVITANGAGQVRYSVTAAATDLYEEKTQEFSVTFSKAAGNLAPDYATSKPTNLTICVGHTSDDITLPTGWRFQSKTTLGQVGNVTLTAVFTPSDTANYSVYTENFTIVVTDHTGGTAASCTTAQVCTECGEVLVEALGHNYNEQVDNTVRTTAQHCQECNTYWYDCSRCGASAKNDANATDKWYTSNEAGEHNMSFDWTSENGQHFHKCTVSGCDHTDTKVKCTGGMPTCVSPAICSVCQNPYGSVTAHHFYDTSEWGYKGTDGHAHVCEYCGVHDTVVGHTPNVSAATEETAKYCTVCDFVIEQQLNHVHSEGTEWKYDSEYHWHDCVGNDGQEYSKAKHTYDNDCDTTCNVCGAIRTITHNYTKLEKSETEHWYVCSVCGAEKPNSRTGHSGGTKDCQHKAECATCGQTYGDFGDHAYDTTVWVSVDNEHHAHKCTLCAAYTDATDHYSADEATCTNEQLCDSCNHKMADALGHSYTKKIESPAYLKAEGTDCQSHHTYYYACERCDASSKDDTDTFFEGVAVGAHKMSATWTTEYAEETNAGWHYHACTVDGCDYREDEGDCHGGERTCIALAICSTCQKAYGEYAEHSFGNTWEYKDATGHAHVCTVKGCNEHDEIKAHTPNIPAATEESAQYCTACQYQMAAQLNHTHSPATEWTSNATHHWKACGGCDEHLEEAPHSYDPNNACDTTCEVCNAAREVSHDFTGEWEKDASGHWHVCAKNGCSVTDTKQNHESAGAATETDPEVCRICGWEINPALGHTTHTPEAEWQKNETHHWHECTGCDGQELNKAAHEYDNNCDTDCNVCGAPRTVAHDFTGEWQKDASGHWHVCATNGCSVIDTKQNHESAGAATETNPEVCSVCGWVINQALGHTTHTPETEWQKDDTYHWHECAGCEGQELEKATHNDGNSDGSCDTCGYAMGTTPPPHTHSHGTTWVTDANEHWNECECGDKANKAAHVDDNGDNKCDTCDYTMPAHDPDTPPVDNPPTDDNDGLGTGAIIGIVVAAVAVVGGGGFALFWFVIRKKRR